MSVLFCGKSWPPRTTRLTQSVPADVDLSPLSELQMLETLNLRNAHGEARDFLEQRTAEELVHWDTLVESGMTDSAARIALVGALDLAPLGALRRLGCLYLDGTQVADLQPLAMVTSLYWLRLNNTEVSDLSPLSALENLRWLHLNHTNVVDLAPLVTLTNLKELHIQHTQVREPEISRLQGSLPQLTVFA